MALSPPLATVDDLSTFMRIQFSAAEEDQAYLILQVVSAWVRTVAGKNWNNTDLLPPDDVVGVVLSATRRELDNPNRIISETMGPLSVTRAVPPDGFFTAGELAILKRKASGTLFTISTRREEENWGTGYIHMREDLSDEPFPYMDRRDPGWPGTLNL